MEFDRSSWRVVVGCEEVLEFALALTLGRRANDVGYTFGPIPRLMRSIVGICVVSLSLILLASIMGLAEGSFLLPISKKSRWKRNV